MNTSEAEQDKHRASKGAIAKSFFKIGCIGFGGGSALIPIIERELTERRRFMKKEAYLQHTVIANITPGALPVKLGATCGYQLGGPLGSLLGAYGVMLPGVLLTVAIMALFSMLGAGALQYFNCASVGITAFIVFLLTAYIGRTLGSGERRVNIVLFLIAFLLTGGKEVRQLAAMIFGQAAATSPLLDISTINLMIITIYLILLKCYAEKRAFIIGACLSAVYAVLTGKLANNLELGGYSFIPLLCMAALLVAVILKKRGRKKGGRLSIAKKTWYAVGGFFLAAAALSLAALLLCGEGALSFLGQVGLSTVTSFGGGEAYVSVADGLFVQSGLVSADVFYSRLVPVANALPGPILVKIAAGVGFVFASEVSPFAGWILALASAGVATGLCSALAVLLSDVYDSISESPLVTGLKQYILPVICGMLLSTSCSMLVESIHVLSDFSIHGAAAFGIMALWVAALLLLTRKKHINDLILLLGSAGISLAGLMFLA